MNKRFRLAAVAAAAGLVLAACGEAPDEGDDTAAGDGEPTNGETAEAENGEDGEDGEDGEAASDFLACMVTDEGGVDDRSFNQSAWEGLLAAEEAGAIGEPTVVESNATADYEPNVSNMVARDCGIIVTVGFLLADATAAAAEENTDERFAIVDFIYEEAIDNVKPLVFNTHEAAFLAGYLSAGYSSTGTVATWGGQQIPTVTIFMDGYYDGVQHYNEQNDADVEVLGWDKEAQDGQFVGDFSDTGLALQISENLINQGADVVHPVAGPLAEQAAIAAQDAGDTAVIWADTDGYESAPDYQDVFLTSVMKGISVSVEQAATSTAQGEFSAEPFIGTLENEGVGIAPYHDFEDEISQELKDEVDALREQIISGELVVESEAAF